MKVVKKGKASVVFSSRNKVEVRFKNNSRQNKIKIIRIKIIYWKIIKFPNLKNKKKCKVTCSQYNM